MIYFYRLAWVLLLPIFLVRQCWKSRSIAKGLSVFIKKCGWQYIEWVPQQQNTEGQGKSSPRRIWLHAVSLGEVRTLRPLVQECSLQQNIELFLTTTTETGYSALERIAAEYPKIVRIGYYPYDCCFSVALLLSRVKPTLFATVEAEIWPEMLRQCQSHHKNHHSVIKTVLVNGRISKGSMRGYQRIDPLLHAVWRDIDYCLVRTQKDADALLTLGVASQKITVVGDMRFDVAVSDASQDIKRILSAFSQKHIPILLAASVHKEEFEVVSQQLAPMQTGSDALSVIPVLLWVPRHPEQFLPQYQALRALVTGQVCLWSELTCSSKLPSDLAEISVIVVDQIGILMELYTQADLSIVCGSFLQGIGGHNIVEPAIAGCPAITGPYHENFVEIVALYEQGDALMVVQPENLAKTAMAVIGNEQQKSMMKHNATQLVQSNAGATSRTCALLLSL